MSLTVDEMFDRFIEQAKVPGIPTYIDALKLVYRAGFRHAMLTMTQVSVSSEGEAIALQSQLNSLADQTAVVQAFDRCAIVNEVEKSCH